MTTYIALLRGINVGGRNKVAMADLQSIFRNLGHQNVTTYLQSGNVIFQNEHAGIAGIAATAEAALAARLQVAVKVLLRTPAELADLISQPPFPVDALHVTFLERAPQAERVRALDPQAGDPDRYQVSGRHLYLHVPGGYGRTKLNNAFWERRLAVAATTRSWKTVLRLRELAGGGACRPVPPT